MLFIIKLFYNKFVYLLFIYLFISMQFAMAVNYLHIWPRQTFMLIALPNQVHVLTIFFEMRKLLSRVGAAHKVSPNWSLETMTCHSSNCFSIVWGRGNTLVVTSLPSSCYLTPVIVRLQSNLQADTHGTLPSGDVHLIQVSFTENVRRKCGNSLKLFVSWNEMLMDHATVLNHIYQMTKQKCHLSNQRLTIPTHEIMITREI